MHKELEELSIKVLKGREILLSGVSYKTYIIYPDEYIEIEYKIISFMITMGMLKLDSGNYETGDRYYLLNSKFNYTDIFDVNSKYIIMHLRKINRHISIKKLSL